MDLHSFQKKVLIFEQKDVHSALIRLNTVVVILYIYKLHLYIIYLII